LNQKEQFLAVVKLKWVEHKDNYVARGRQGKLTRVGRKEEKKKKKERRKRRAAEIEFVKTPYFIYLTSG